DPRPPLLPYTTLFRSPKPATRKQGTLTNKPSACGIPNSSCYQSRMPSVLSLSFHVRISGAGRRCRHHWVSRVLVGIGCSLKLLRSEEHTSELQSRGHL